MGTRILSCTECEGPDHWNGITQIRCDFCGSCRHEPHTQECKQAWRSLILSYESKERHMPKPCSEHNEYQPDCPLCNLQDPPEE